MGNFFGLILNRKLEEANSQKGDLLQMIAKREETILHTQKRLEEKSRECSSLSRQLEEALEDARRQVCTFTTPMTLQNVLLHMAVQQSECLAKVVQRHDSTLLLICLQNKYNGKRLGIILDRKHKSNWG